MSPDSPKHNPLDPQRRIQPAAAVALFLVLVHGVLGWAARPAGVETAQDDARYLLLAESLESFQYTDPWNIDHPIHSQYPPVYPATLAIWSNVFGDSYDTLAFLGVIVAMASLALAWYAARRLTTPWIAVACLVPLAFNPYLLANIGELRSETLFMFFTLVALVCAGFGESRALIITAAVAAILAGLTRTIGVAVVAAVGLHWLLARRHRTFATFTVVSIATVGAWLAWTIFSPEQWAGASYIADLIAVPADAQRSLWDKLIDPFYPKIPRYLGMAIPFRLPFPTIPNTPIDNVITALVTTVGLVSGFVLFALRWRVAALFLFTYGMVLVAFPWQSGRFFEPIMPLLIIGIVLGLGSLAKRHSEKAYMATIWTVAAVIAVTGLAQTLPMLRFFAPCHEDFEMPPARCVTTDAGSFFAALDYINRHVPEEAVFMSAKAEPLFYYTRRPSVLIERAVRNSPDDFVPFLEDAGVDHILLGSLQSAEVYNFPGLMSPNCNRFELLETFPPRTYLFRILPTADSTAGRVTCDAVRHYQAANVDRNFAEDARW